MNFEEAKQKLILNAVGHNDYNETVTTWEELEEKASFEESQALVIADQLGDVYSVAKYEAEVERERTKGIDKDLS